MSSNCSLGQGTYSKLVLLRVLALFIAVFVPFMLKSLI